MTRSGFTLVELLLVLALLVVGAAIASVGLSAGNERTQLRQAAETLRLAWAEARLEAIESGRPRVFRCRIGDGWGYVGDAEDPAVLAGAVAQSDEDQTDQSESSELRLARGGSPVVFERLLVTDRPGAAAVGGAVREGDLSAMVVFYPDGATTDAEATLATEAGGTLLVTLRGLTGASRVTEPTDPRTVGGGR